MEICSVLCAACMGGEFEKEEIHVYVWLSPFAVTESITILLIQYKIKSLEKKRKGFPLGCLFFVSPHL